MICPHLCNSISNPVCGIALLSVNTSFIPLARSLVPNLWGQLQIFTNLFFSKIRSKPSASASKWCTLPFLFNYSTRPYEEIHLPTGRHLPGNNSCRYTYKIDEGMAMIGAPQVPQGDVKCPRVTSISPPTLKKFLRKSWLRSLCHGWCIWWLLHVDRGRYQLAVTLIMCAP
jgi:hypothetical protein